jgi:hypothetical protein
MGKKPKHRVRHVPPGPCGIWFQAVQAKKKQRRHSTGTTTSNHLGQPSSAAAAVGQTSPSAAAEISIFGYELTQQPAYSQDGKSPDKNNKLEDTPSAWQAMQTETNVLTPYNPTPWTTVLDPEDRYQVVRSNIPDHYVTLWEILRGDVDMKMAPHQRLRVLVHAVEMSNHHNIWTVDLRDDTGASMRAWMEPRFIQEQLQSSMMDEDEMNMIRPGLVWMLKDVSMMIVHSSLTGSSSKMSEERLERMLLISGQHIEKIWYPTGKGDRGSMDNQQRRHHEQSQDSGDAPADNLNMDQSQPQNSLARSMGRPHQHVDSDDCTTPINRKNGMDGIQSTPIHADGLFREIRRQQSRDGPLADRDVNSVIKNQPFMHPNSQCGQGQRNNDLLQPSQVSQQVDDQEKPPANEILIRSVQGTSQTLTMDTAIAYDSQQILESQPADPSQSNKNTAGYTGTSLNTQESNFLHAAKDARELESRSSTLAFRRQQQGEEASAPKSSQTPKKKQKEKHNQYSPVRNRTPTRRAVQSPIPTPSRSPLRSPRKAYAGGDSMWDTPHEILFEAIEQEEQKWNNSQPSTLGVDASTQRSTESECPTLYRMTGEFGKIFEPTTWSTAGLKVLDDHLTID